MVDATISDAELANDLANRVNKLIPLRIDPERFHIERDGIARDLRKLAKRLAGAPTARSMRVWRS